MKSILLALILLSTSLFAKEHIKTLQEASDEIKVFNALDVNNGMPIFESGNYLEYSKNLRKYLSEVEAKYPGYKLPGVKQLLRKDYMMQSRVSLNGDLSEIDYVSAFEVYNKLKQKAEKSNELLALNEWSFIGPSVRPIQRNGMESSRGTGRANVIRIDPSNDNILWVGAAGGGVWKSTDKGKTWKTFEITGFASLGISDIAIAKSNSNIVYAATGDKNTGGNGSGGLYNFNSIGLLKTVNGGNTWELTNFIKGTQPSNGRLIYKVIVHPTNPENLYITASNGFFNSTDGGSSWQTIDATRGYGDMEMHPTNPNLIYVMRTDSYASKTVRTYNASSNEFISEQLYTSAVRGEIAVTKANPDMVMLLFANTNSAFRSVEKSTNRGATWFTTTSINNGVNYLGFSNGQGQDLQQGQGWYDLTINISPTNENEVYIGGVNIWKSVNGGSSFNLNTFWQFIQGYPFVHADQHYLEYDSKGTLYSTNDGGVRYSTNNGSTWNDISDGLAISQFYRFSQSMQDPKFFIAGAQDNSTFVKENDTWYEALGGDGFHTAVDPKDDNFVYGSNNVGGSGGLISRSSNRGVSFTTSIGPAQYGTGESAMWVTPFEVDPTNTSKVYAGYENIWVSSNKGVQGSWTKLTNFNANANVRYIAISTVDNNKLFCSIGGNLIEVNKTTGTWKIIYQSGNQINSIFADLIDPNLVYVTLGGFSGTNKVIQVNNGSASNITYNLPNFSANTIIQQPITGDLFVGMDAGVYKLTKNKTNWTVFDKGLPTTVVSELEIQKSTGKLRAATHGRGIWEVELFDCDLTAPTISAGGKVDLCDGESVVLTYNGNSNNIEWSTGAKTKSISVNTAGKYYLTLYDNTGCFAQSETIDVTVSEKVDVVINVPDNKTVYCDGDEVRLSLPLSTGAGSYKWSNGETSRNNNIRESGDYWVEFTKTGTSCSYRSAVVTISFRETPAIPTIEKSGNDLKAVGSSGQYQWFLNGERLTGAIKDTYTPKADGIYTVSATNSNNCSQTSEEFAVSWLSIDNSIFEGISLSPNPNDGEFELRVNTQLVGVADLSVIDITGQEVFNEKVNFLGSEFIKNIKLNNLAKGVYFLKINSGVNEINAKFVVK